jgi:UDPglucose--hexose-1-phosphate uridylyltransferase
MKKPSRAIVKPAKPTQNSEIRKHYFLDNYVVIAPKRNLRPDSFSHLGEAHKVLNPNCHFCHSTEPSLWQAPKGHDWQVKVIQNAFPAFSLNNPQAFGIQEVVIDTPEHDLEFSELPVNHIETIFEAYHRRLVHLKAIEGIRYVLVFKNDGPLAGASISHAHCQVYALPLVPPKIEQESDALNHYWDSHQSCGYCDVIAWEQDHKVRVIFEDKHVLAVSPYAASFAFECWLIPKRHVTEFALLNQSELHSIATLLKKITAKLDSTAISFNFFLQESLSTQNHHFVIKVEPRTTKWAGAELGTGIIINPVTPEYAAMWYQGKV